MRVPADWEPQGGVWLAWPHNRETWPGTQNGRPRFDAVEPFFASCIRQIAEVTPVYLLADTTLAKRSQVAIGSDDSITVVNLPTNDVWVRDYAPTFVVSRTTGKRRGVDWRYNAWGGKYGPCEQDNAVASSICEFLDLPFTTSSLCLEGGALEFDGDRRLITTPGCLITDSRNPGWTKKQIAEEIFMQTGVTEIAWIDGGGIEGDDTDGHIDQLARFVDHQNIVVAVAEPSDKNHDPLQANWNQLQQWASSTDPRVELHPLPLPPARFVDGKRVPESYCNFLRLGTECIFLPIFHAKTDAHAIGIMKELTGANIHPIDCRVLAWGLGAIHCASREFPSLQDPNR